jgi:hypothetical protein
LVDTDADGLTDWQELVGHPVGARRFPVAGRGNLITIPVTTPGTDDSEVIPFTGATPTAPDVLIEVDYMPANGTTDGVVSHLPYPNLLADLQRIFGDNAYHGRPINIRIAPAGNAARNSQQLPQHFAGIRFGGCSSSVPAIRNDRVNFYTLKNNPALFNPIRNSIYHYVVVAHSLFTDTGNCALPVQSPSGIAKVLGSDVIISLGPSVPARIPDQRGLHIHELGHNFGLRHNGNGQNDGRNSCVHSSVMNYRYNLAGWPGTPVNLRNFGYSVGRCDVLSFGVPMGCPTNTRCENACLRP